MAPGQGDLMRSPAVLVAVFVCTARAPAQQPGPLRIGSAAARPGEIGSGFIDVPAGSDSGTRIPLTIVRGREPGPTLALIAGTHGDEVAPIIALQRVRRELDPTRLRGTVLLVHVANLPSFLRRTVYYSPIRSEEHTSELQSRLHLVCRLLLEKKKQDEQQGHDVADSGLPAPTIRLFFFFNDTATTEIYTLSLHDALPISATRSRRSSHCSASGASSTPRASAARCCWCTSPTCPRSCAAPSTIVRSDRKSTRLNSSHGYISYAVFCLKKKNKTNNKVMT